MQGRDLRGSKFVDCTVGSCDLAVAHGTDCSFLRVRFRECRLSGINWSLARKLETVSFERCQLNDGSFFGLQLEKCEFAECVALGTSFRDANLANANFREANLSGAELVNCDLRGADFGGSHNYVLSPATNHVDKARFSLPGANNRLSGFGIIVD